MNNQKSLSCSSGFDNSFVVWLVLCDGEWSALCPLEKIDFEVMPESSVSSLIACLGSTLEYIM